MPSHVGKLPTLVLAVACGVVIIGTSMFDSALGYHRLCSDYYLYMLHYYCHVKYTNRQRYAKAR